MNTPSFVSTPCTWTVEAKVRGVWVVIGTVVARNHLAARYEASRRFRRAYAAIRVI